MASFRYLYDGTKVAAVRSDGTSIRYQGSFVLACTSTGFPSAIKSIAWADGVCAAKDGGSGYGDYLYVKDHLGNVRDIVAIYKADTTPLASVVVEKSDYLPFGERISDLTSPYASTPFSSTTDTHRWHLGSKEEVPEGHLNLLDFGARYYSPALCRWTSVDPLAEKYYGVSPYVYCLNNPATLFDPDGRYIDGNSRKEWDSHRKRVNKELERVTKKLKRFESKGKTDGRNYIKLKEREAGLKDINKNLDIIEFSTQGYALKQSDLERGGINYDSATGNINICITGSTANFVHETTHAGQFESGDIGVTMNNTTIAQDIYDEVSAYRAQYIFQNLCPSDVTPDWVKSLTDAQGCLIYTPYGHCRTSPTPIDKNTLLFDAFKAYNLTPPEGYNNEPLYKIEDFIFKH